MRLRGPEERRARTPEEPLAIAACLLVLLVGCSKSEQRAPVREDARASWPDKLEGTLELNGKRLALTTCAPGRDGSIYVDVGTDQGTLRWKAYEDKRMFWSGAPLACSTLTRSWGGGSRPDGTTYVRGQLRFACEGTAGSFRGELAIDCGHIDDTERRLLDESRRRHLTERGSPQPEEPPARPSPSR